MSSLHSVGEYLNAEYSIWIVIVEEWDLVIWLEKMWAIIIAKRAVKEEGSRHFCLGGLGTAK